MRLAPVLLTFAVLALSAAAANPPKRGDVLFELAMPAPNASTSRGASWAADPASGTTVVKVTAGADRRDGATAINVPIDLRPYRGMQVMLVCEAKADNVSQPAQPWLGLKCMLHYRSATGDHWINANNVHGTFDWRPVSCRASIDDDATDGNLMLGLQGSSGTAWLRNVRLLAWRVPPVRPAQPSAATAPYRGHNLPRLRGVMSPSQFREEDFAELARWNGNVVRWQLVRNWGRAGTDRDLAEYDRWIDGKLAELDHVLASAQQHGIKVVIDLHQPPGGREEDNTLTMLIDRRYQEHFVAVWERIARKFKGHPALWAYDLINEPVQNTVTPPGLEDWLGIQIKAAEAIRRIDPVTAIAIEVDEWDSPDAFRWLAPVSIPNVIYQVHMYQPGEYTHQGVHNNWGEKGRDHLLAYPGEIRGLPFDRQSLRRRLQPVRDFQLAHNVHIYVGEFSAIRWAPGADRYLADLIEIFEEYGWDWTYHAWREWPGWSVEHADLPADPARHVKATEPTARALVIQRWFAKNQRSRE